MKKNKHTKTCSSCGRKFKNSMNFLTHKCEEQAEVIDGRE